MDLAEAKNHCAQLAAEHPDRATNNWIPAKQQDGTWTVARIPVPQAQQASYAHERGPDPAPRS